MKFFYQNKSIYQQKEIKKDLIYPGAEVAYILANKMLSVNPTMKLVAFEGKKEDGSISRMFSLLKHNSYGHESIINIDGEMGLDWGVPKDIKDNLQIKEYEIKDVTLNDLEPFLNLHLYEMAHSILKNFYIIQLDKKVQDRNGDEYRLVIISNADTTIGEHLYIDELKLFKGNQEIGYLKAKYTTPELMKQHGIPKSKKDDFKNQATIDFSNLEYPYRNKGLGYVMYFHMAQHLNSKGIDFRQSTICSDSAQRLWKSIEVNFSDNVTTKYKKVFDEKVKVSFLSIGQDCSLSFTDKKPTIHKKLNVN